MMLRVAVAAAVLASGPVLAADNFAGRWAADPAGCRPSLFEPSPLVVTGYSLRWRDDACRIARVYKTGDTVHIQAQCWGERGARSVPVSLRAHAGRLELRWDRMRAGSLRRCR